MQVGTEGRSFTELLSVVHILLPLKDLHVHVHVLRVLFLYMYRNKTLVPISTIILFSLLGCVYLLFS